MPKTTPETTPRITKLLLIFSTLVCPLFYGASSFANSDSEAIKRAVESSLNCSNFVRYDKENIYLGFGSYKRKFEEPRQPIPATLQVTSIINPAVNFKIATADAAIDSLRDGKSLFILTYSGIEEWDLLQKSRVAIYPTTPFRGTLAYLQHAQSFARFGDKAIIAHGRLGVSIFNLKTKQVEKEIHLLQRQLPLESTAVGVTVQGKYAYIAMDNFSLVEKGHPAFRGLVVIDMTREAVVGELDGMDPGADAVVSDGKKLIVSFGGIPIWKYALNSFRGSQLPEPENRVWRFPLKGHPTGIPSMDDKYYYTCFYQAPAKPGEPYKKLPLALDRRVLMLD